MSDGMELTPEDVKEILQLVEESGIDELELETPRFTVRFRRHESREAGDAPEAGAGDSGLSAIDSELSANASASTYHAPPEGLVDVTSPMVGTFYRAPAPGADPFVEVGTVLDPSATVCIIEVMKLMHSVAAGVSGTVAEVCVENERPVQYGDVLFRVQTR